MAAASRLMSSSSDCMQQAGGGEFHAPVVQLGPAVALPVDDPARAGGVAQAAVGRHPVERWRRADALAVAHLIEPEVLGVLEERDERFFEERQHGIGRAVAVLNPPGVPGRTFDQAVPGRHVEHGQVLELGIGREHPARRVEQPQILDIALTLEKPTVKLSLLGRGQERGGDEQENPHLARSESIHRFAF